jgi:putative transposase
MSRRIQPPSGRPSNYEKRFPFDHGPLYLLRDGDRNFDGEFRTNVKAMEIRELLSGPRPPWLRAYVERVIGTIRRECLDHLIIFNEASL